jgi:hypothetical protein
MSYGPHLYSTLYVGQPLNLPPLTAQAAFDTLHQTSAVDTAADRWIFETAAGELRLQGADVTDSPGAMWALRRAPGCLHRRGRLNRLAIELELTPWSKRRCEIGIRHCGWLAPMTEGRRQRRYVALAAEVAESLALKLEALVDSWISAQLIAPTTAGRMTTFATGSRPDSPRGG